jgi:hypothetical protein
VVKVQEAEQQHAARQGSLQRTNEATCEKKKEKKGNTNRMKKKGTIF